MLTLIVLICSPHFQLHASFSHLRTYFLADIAHPLSLPHPTPTLPCTPQEFFMEASRILRPAGTLTIVTDNLWYGRLLLKLVAGMISRGGAPGGRVSSAGGLGRKRYFSDGPGDQDAEDAEDAEDADESGADPEKELEQGGSTRAVVPFAESRVFVLRSERRQPASSRRPNSGKGGGQGGSGSEGGGGREGGGTGKSGFYSEWRVQEEDAGGSGATLFVGTPGPAAGHVVEASSYFDRYVCVCLCVCVRECVYANRR